MKYVINRFLLLQKKLVVLGVPRRLLKKTGLPLMLTPRLRLVVLVHFLMHVP